MNILKLVNDFPELRFELSSELNGGMVLRITGYGSGSMLSQTISITADAWENGVEYIEDHVRYLCDQLKNRIT